MARVYISIGSNIDRDENIRSGMCSLEKKYGKLTLSSVYDSESVGFDGDDFYNLVAGFDTDDDLFELAETLRGIEDHHHRDRSGQRFSSRTLDIDLLLYDNLIVNERGVRIPRDEITSSAFVLGPLAEIDGSLLHPELKKTVLSLWQAFDKSTQPMQRIEFDW